MRGCAHPVRARLLAAAGSIGTESSSSTSLVVRSRLLLQGGQSRRHVAVVVRWRSSLESRGEYDAVGSRANGRLGLWRRASTGSRQTEARHRRKSTSTAALVDGGGGGRSSRDDGSIDKDGVGSILVLGPRTTYRLLGLERFTDAEIDGVFDSIVTSRRRQRAGTTKVCDGASEENLKDKWLDHSDLTAYILDRIRKDLDDTRRHDPTLAPDVLKRRVERYASATASSILEKFRPVSSVVCDRRGTITDEEDEVLGGPSTRLVLRKPDFRARVKELAAEVDAKKALPISLSMLMIGSSVGVVTPVMPFVVENLGLTPGQYGTVVSAFALAKIAGNVPSAVLVERHGRRPYLVYSLCLVSAGVAGIGLAGCWEHLFAFRLLTGLGVAALSTAATMTMADISTPLNRASTMAPIMSAFSAGMAFGPAVGGMLADHLGISETFYAVGASYLGLTLINRALLVETKAKPLSFPWHCPDRSSRDAGFEGEADKSMLDATREALSQWSPLLSDSRIRHAVMMNGFYWTSLAGSQMTLLPLLLTDPSGLALSATAVGRTYMGMSCVQVVGVPLMARFVDRVGKPRSIVAGCTLIGGSMMALPYCSTFPEMAATLGTWSLGSSILSTAPVSYVSDIAGEERRAQAVALLRTTGDVGFLVGAGGIGMAADWTGDLGSAMHCGAGVLMGATAWFAVRRVLMAGREEMEHAAKKNEKVQQR